MSFQDADFSYQLFRLLQQLPKSEMTKTVECWAKLVFPLLVSSAIKVHIVRSTSTSFITDCGNKLSNKQTSNQSTKQTNKKTKGSMRKLEIRCGLHLSHYRARIRLFNRKELRKSQWQGISVSQICRFLKNFLSISTNLRKSGWRKEDIRGKGR